MDVDRTCNIIEELTALNLAGVDLAREVMLAREVADDLEHAAERTLDRLRGAPRDELGRPPEEAVDEAVAANSADAAHDAEIAASSAYATHVERSRRAADEARRLVADLACARSTGSDDRRPLRSARRALRAGVRVRS